jgi:hypothetical protein
MGLVGFFDILGTGERVMSERFSDIDALEFVNAIGIAARFTPTVRFAVFSDSLIVSAELTEVRPLLRAINFMYGNWFGELVRVRGAISCGDIRWVTDAVSDGLFRGCPNLTYARVYGKGLVIAYDLERSSGPGAICFLTEGAAELFRGVETNSVLDGLTPMLCWATESQAKMLEGYATNHLEQTEKESGERRHAAATKHYCTTLVEQRKFLSDDYAVS